MINAVIDGLCQPVKFGSNNQGKWWPFRGTPPQILDSLWTAKVDPTHRDPAASWAAVALSSYGEPSPCGREDHQASLSINMVTVYPLTHHICWRIEGACQRLGTFLGPRGASWRDSSHEDPLCSTDLVIGRDNAAGRALYGFGEEEVIAGACYSQHGVVGRSKQWMQKTVTRYQTT